MKVFIAKAEHPEKYEWWLNELDSRGISTLQKNGLDNPKEASDLTEVVIKTHPEKMSHKFSGKPSMVLTSSTVFLANRIMRLAYNDF
jgi:hypothetical protein